METLAHSIAQKIATHMDFDEDKKAVIAYGLTAILQIIFIFIIISIIGIVFDFWFESIIIFLGVGLIRKSTGGAHSQTMYGCIVISILSVSLLSALARYIVNFPWFMLHNFIISLITYITCGSIFYLRVPVDNPKKPIETPKKIKRLRKQSFIILTIFFLLSVVTILLTTLSYRFYSITSILRLTMLWQAFTLTKFGICFFEKVDQGFLLVFEHN